MSSPMTSGMARMTAMIFPTSANKSASNDALSFHPCPRVALLHEVPGYPGTPYLRSLSTFFRIRRLPTLTGGVPLPPRDGGSGWDLLGQIPRVERSDHGASQAIAAAHRPAQWPGPGGGSHRPARIRLDGKRQADVQAGEGRSHLAHGGGCGLLLVPLGVPASHRGGRHPGPPPRGP